MLGRRSAFPADLDRFFQRHIENTNPMRGSDLSRDTLLGRSEIFVSVGFRGRVWIGKVDQAPGKVSTAISRQFERDRLIAIL